jgi:hypothetical protein
VKNLLIVAKQMCKYVVKFMTTQHKKSKNHPVNPVNPLNPGSKKYIPLIPANSLNPGSEILTSGKS